MRGHGRAILQWTQLMVICAVFGYLCNHFSSDERSSWLKHRSRLLRKYQAMMDLQHNGEMEEEEEEGPPPSRATTDTPPEPSQDDQQVEMTTFLPYGPDESPPGKPATIPKTFPIEESDFCQKRPDLDIIAYVHSSIKRAGPRNVTRATWARASEYNLGLKIGAVFMVGRPKNEDEQRILKEESQRYHDIVQGDYADHYRLLSYKGLAGLYWINKHCSHVKWTMHSDDDVNIDIFLYWQKIMALDANVTHRFICSHMYGPALRVGRWFVSYEQYPKLNYPLYCSGGLWFLQTKKVPLLLEASKSVPFLWVDDAYITGLLAIKAGIERHPFQKFYGHPKPELEDIGEKVAWFFLSQSRREVWDKIIEYHSKRKIENDRNKTLTAESQSRQ